GRGVENHRGYWIGWGALAPRRGNPARPPRAPAPAGGGGVGAGGAGEEHRRGGRGRPARRRRRRRRRPGRPPAAGRDGREELRRRGGASGDRLVQADGLVERGDGEGDVVELESGHRSCSGAEAGREGRGKGSRRLARNACLKEKAMAVNGKILEITDANFV